jgi:D-alanine--poly(phosphoribitol) ligase subunit 1
MFFDNSVFDFYAAMLSGAALVPIYLEPSFEPRTLVRLINGARCTIWFSVPSLLIYLLATRALAATDFPSLRKIIFGGEGFPKPKLKQLYDLFGSRVDLENVYGPTECTCICSAHMIAPGDFGDMQALAPLGLLAPNFGYEILPTTGDSNVGELFLRGPNVGLGYYDDPPRTAEVFIQNPTHHHYSDIGYRTGDLVRRDTAGLLHFSGRLDFQIKHLGYRIELEEVEAALGTLDGVDECAVVYRKLAHGLGEIVGFAALSADRQSEQLIRGVAGILPSYMVPRRIAIVKALPKNANGKIDRAALQAIAAS